MTDLTARPPAAQPGTHLRLLLNQVLSQNAHHVAVRDASSGQSWTFADLSSQSALVAQQLRSSSGPVALYFDPSFAYLVAVIAVVRLGRPYVAVDPKLPRHQQQRMLAETRVTVLLHCDSLPPNFKSRNVQTHSIEEVVRDLSGETGYEWPIADSSVMCILYTSGSTNMPKAVVIPYSAVLNRLSWQWRTQPFDEEDVVALKTGIGFVDSIAELWSPLLKGVPLVTLPTSFLSDSHLILRTLKEFKVTRFTLVPSLLQNLLVCLKESPELCSMALRTVVSSGEELRLETCEAFFSCLPQCQLHNYYGSTEVMGDVTAIKFCAIEEARAASHGGRICIGTAIDNMELALHNPDNEGVGEIFCAGAGLAAGYLNAAGKCPSSCSSFSTAKHFNLRHSNVREDGMWFRTGDLARIHNGKIFFCGRRDDVVKIAGNKVDIGEVARVVGELAPFKFTPVIVYCHPLKKLILLYRNNEEIDAQELSVGLCRELPPPARPTLVPVADFFFRPNSGKVDKKAMLARFEDDFFSNTATAYNWASMSHLSSAGVQKLQSFVEILAQERIRSGSLETLLASNFFTAGGTSLNMVTCLSRLRSHGLEIGMQEFFEAKSLGEIFHRLLDQQPECPPSPVSGFTTKPLDTSTAPAAWEIIANNMVDPEPMRYLWDTCPDSAKAREECYGEFLVIANALEASFLKKPHLSFGLFDVNGSLVGVCGNVASDCDPQAIPSGGIVTKFLHFLNEIEASTVSRLQKMGHSGVFMESLITVVDRNKIKDPALRVKCMHLMEQESIRIAEHNSMAFVITTNINQVTQDIAPLLGYEVERVYNGFLEWVDQDGVPFVSPTGSGSFDIQVCYKLLNGKH